MFLPTPHLTVAQILNRTIADLSVKPQFFCRLLKSYRIRKVVGDRYGGEWPRERFSEHGVEYVVSSKAKSDIYRTVLPALNSGRVENGPTLPEVDATGVCCMQKGFTVSQGIGCSNAAGTSGGPNDCAQGLTLCTAPPADVHTFSYIVWTPGIPGFVTNSSFAGPLPAFLMRSMTSLCISM